MSIKQFMAGAAAAVLMSLVIAMCGCHSIQESASLQKYVFNEPHMGTIFSITLYAPDPSTATAAAEAGFREVTKLDQMMTDYHAGSELRNLWLRPVGVPTRVSPEMFELLQESQRVAKETDGAFDVTVGPFTQAWRVSRKLKRLPDAEDLAKLRLAVGYQHLKLDARTQSVTLLVPDMKIDLGGIAKGYAADKALAIIRRMGMRSALVAASGDIAIGDAPPGKGGWRVGIQSMDGSPDDMTQYILLHNTGVSTSGDSAQNVEINGIRYSHIIDPATGLGMTNSIQTTIIGPNATTTDGLDTPTAIMGVKRALAFVNARPKLAALIVTHDEAGNHVFTSRRFEERFGKGTASQGK